MSSRSPGRIPALFLAAMLLAAQPLSAALVYQVDSTADEIDDDTSDGVCHTDAGTCTLRAAVMQANKASGPAVTINVPAGTYTLVRPAGSGGADTNGSLTLTTPANNTVIHIVGAGAAVTIVDAGQIDRVLGVQSNRTASLSGITLRNGVATLVGAGILVTEAELTLDHVTVTDNDASSGDGGGIANNNGIVYMNYTTVTGNKGGRGAGISNYGSLVAKYSTISDNQALVNAGGLMNYVDAFVYHSTFTGNSGVEGGAVLVDANASLVLDRSTLSGNLAYAIGGAIRIQPAGTLLMTQSTISSNHSAVHGGGIYTDGSANIYNSTIVFNEAAATANSGAGGGIYVDNGTTNVRNTVIAGNFLADPSIYNDCTGVIGIYGNNKFWNAAGCFAAAGSTGSGTDLDSLSELGPLQDNGGPTLTHAIVAPSAMIDGGDAVGGCLDYNSDQLPTDQRDAPRVAGVRCDIGAVEYGSVTDPIFADGFQ